MRILNRIVSYNLWPIGHYFDFEVDRATFFYALATEVPIDFASHAIRLMLAAFVDGTLSLPFGGLITHIFSHLGIEPEAGEPVITSIASFNKKTIAKSSGQVEHHISMGVKKNREIKNQETGSRFWFRFGKTQNQVPPF